MKYILQLEDITFLYLEEYKCMVNEYCVVQKLDFFYFLLVTMDS